jgi:hypothetical protein
MRFRKLRIAWSVVWGMAALLLIVMWVRSYWRLDSFQCRVHGRYYVAVMSTQPILGVGYNCAPTRGAAEDIFVTSLCTFGSLDRIQDGTSIVLAIPTWSAGVDRGANWSVHATSPHWFPTLISGVLATLPWIRQLRCRFTLRTLLIATTLAAVGLGLVVWASHH